MTVPELIHCCQFGEVVEQVRRLAPEPGSPYPIDYALAAAAAQHLDDWDSARNFAACWAEENEHVERGQLVSIIIPTRDRSALLSRALTSVASQLYRPIEVIVINDAGAPVDEIVENFDKGLNLEVIDNPSNVGVAECRNIGQRQSRGTYIGYLDDDDQLYPHHVGHLVERMQTQGARAAHSIAHVRRRRRSGDYQMVEFPHTAKSFSDGEILVSNLITAQSMLHERTLVDEIGQFDNSLEAMQDWDYWIRLGASTAVAGSALVTSFVDKAHGHARMSNHWRFLRVHALLYERYRVRAEAIGGPQLVEKQQNHLELLKSRSGPSI